jgi:hypothetical protein
VRTLRNKENEFVIKMLESTIKRLFIEELTISPVNSMTPFEVTADGKDEFYFIIKADPYIAEPFVENTSDTFHFQFSMYEEGTSLIVRIECFDDVRMESEIERKVIVPFLKTLYDQEVITFIVIDHITSNIIWANNKFDFSSVRDQFAHFFRKYGIIK